MTKRNDVYATMCSIIAEEDKIWIPAESLRRRKIDKNYELNYFSWKKYFKLEREDWFHATIQECIEPNGKVTYSVYVGKSYWPEWHKYMMRTENIFHFVRSLRAACYIAEVAKENELWLSPLGNRFLTQEEYDEI